MEKNLKEQIIESAVEVHRLLGGPGLLESIYETALCHELKLRGIRSQRQMAIPVLYKGAFVRDPLYLDILVEDQVIIEVKATERDFPFFQVQLSTYLRLTGVKSGLLINFGKQYLKDGICQLVNDPLG
jgi:GxxExxY protein